VDRDARLRVRYEAAASRHVGLLGNLRARLRASPETAGAAARYLSAHRGDGRATGTRTRAHRFCRQGLGPRALLQARGFRPCRQRRDAAECCALRLVMGRRALAPPRALSRGRGGAAPGPRTYRSNMGSSRQPISLSGAPFRTGSSFARHFEGLRSDGVPRRGQGRPVWPVYAGSSVLSQGGLYRIHFTQAKAWLGRGFLWGP